MSGGTDLLAGLASVVVGAIVAAIASSRWRVARTLLVEALKHPRRGTRIDRKTGNVVADETVADKRPLRAHI